MSYRQTSPIARGAPLSPQRGPSQFFPTASELPDPYGHGGGRAANGVVSPIRVRKQGSYRAPSPMHPTAAAGNRSMAYRDPGGRPVSPPMRGPRAMTASEYNAAHLERGWSYKGRSAANTQPTAVPALQRMVNNLMGAQQAVRNMGFASENAQKKESRRPPSVVTPKYDEVQLDGEEEGEGAEAAVGELVERAEGLVTLVPWVLDEFEKSGGNLRKDIADEAVDRLTQCVVEMRSLIISFGGDDPFTAASDDGSHHGFPNVPASPARSASRWREAESGVDSLSEAESLELPRHSDISGGKITSEYELGSSGEGGEHNEDEDDGDVMVNLARATSDRAMKVQRSPPLRSPLLVSPRFGSQQPMSKAPVSPLLGSMKTGGGMPKFRLSRGSSNGGGFQGNMTSEFLKAPNSLPESATSMEGDAPVEGSSPSREGSQFGGSSGLASPFGDAPKEEEEEEEEEEEVDVHISPMVGSIPHDPSKHSPIPQGLSLGRGQGIKTKTLTNTVQSPLVSPAISSMDMPAQAEVKPNKVGEADECPGQGNLSPGLLGPIVRRLSSTPSDFRLGNSGGGEVRVPSGDSNADSTVTALFFGTSSDKGTDSPLPKNAAVTDSTSRRSSKSLQETHAVSLSNFESMAATDAANHRDSPSSPVSGDSQKNKMFPSLIPSQSDSPFAASSSPAPSLLGVTKTLHSPPASGQGASSGPATPWESSSSLLLPRELLASTASSTTSSVSAVSGFNNSNVTEEARGSSTSFSVRRGTSQASSSGSVITDPFLLSLARVQGTDLDSIGSGSVHKSTGSVHDQVRDQDQKAAARHGERADTASLAPSDTSLHVRCISREGSDHNDNDEHFARTASFDAPFNDHEHDPYHPQHHRHQHRHHDEQPHATPSRPEAAVHKELMPLMPVPNGLNGDGASVLPVFGAGVFGEI